MSTSENEPIFDPKTWPRINFVAAAVLWFLTAGAFEKNQILGSTLAICGTLCWVAFCLSPDDRE